jgi:hypothetical protein
MLSETPIFIPIIPDFTPSWKVEVIHAGVTTDVSARVMKGEFTRRILRLGIGQFSLKLNNIGNVYTDSFEGGDIVKFYADLSNGTTQKFYGIIDTPKNSIEAGGQFLTLEGRHRAYLLTETWISKEVSTTTAIYTIVNEIIDNHFSSFTHTNVSTDVSNTITKSWDSQQAIKIFEELCILGTADGYVDDDLDLHLFVENSIYNEDIAIVQGINLLNLKDFGIDSYEARERVTVVGDDGEGLPVLYTSGSGSRQTRPVFNMNVSNVTSAKELADATLSGVTDAPPQGRTLSYGLPVLNVGDNVMISAPRQQVHNAYKIIEIKDMVGKEVRGKWLCECLVEKEFTGTTELIENRIKKEGEITKLQNPNNLEFSYNLTFSDDTYCNHTNTETGDGRLRLISGQTSGSMTTDAYTVTNNITQVELKLKGSDLRSSTFEISANNGITWQTIVKDTLYNVTSSGKYLKVKVSLVLDTANPDPSVDSLVILYK